MKARIHRIFVCLLTYFGLILITSGQEWEVSAGIGLPEVPNVSGRLYGNDVTLGAGYGFVPGNDLRTINVDFGVFYGKPAKNAEARKSVGRLVFTHYREETNSRIFNYSYLAVRAGRKYFFSEHIGLNLEGGLAFKVGENIINKDGSNSFNLITVFDNVFPAASLKFFYRF
ncbi:hypothetical protein [Ekhidna sp.]|uniref:hypothetical protein n=1 Tax=Ekhidna sp. TaxID=2608089 RepID=UPI003B507999